MKKLQATKFSLYSVHHFGLITLELYRILFFLVFGAPTKDV